MRAFAPLAVSLLGGCQVLFAPPDAVEADAAAPEIDAALPACEPGAVLAPVSTFHALNGLGLLCNRDAALSTDDQAAGLDRAIAGGGEEIVPGKVVSACLGFDFGTVESFSYYEIRAAAVEQGCDTPCTDHCMEGDFFGVYSAETPGDYVEVDSYVDVSATRGDFTDRTVPAGPPARYLLICRGGGGATYDDVLVASVAANCGMSQAEN